MTTSPKYLILVRHPESRKNVTGHFSSGDGLEALTEIGDKQVADISANVRTFSERLQLSGCIHTSPTIRTSSVAVMASRYLSWPVETHDGLRPISAGKLAGMQEREAKNIAPHFFRQLSLYRAGLGSSYDITGYGENVHSFERRVAMVINAICDRREPLQLVFGHRSPITAMLLGFARRFHGYPSDFYGYVELSLGGVSLVRVSQGDGEILFVNSDAKALADVEISGRE